MVSLLLLTLTGILALLAELFNFKKFLFQLLIAGFVAVIASLVMQWGGERVTLYGMLRIDSYAIAFTSSILVAAILWMFMSKQYVYEHSSVTDKYALICFTLVGALVLTSYTNLTMLFLGIEILSIPLYVLAGSRKESLSSNEAALKYFLMGSFATGFLLFGIALIYGATATFDIQKIADVVSSKGAEMPSFFYIGVIFMLVGLSFKVSAAPFHFWAPDVYTGAPTTVTAYMATIVKAAAFAAFLKLFRTCFVEIGSTWTVIMSIMVALSLLVSNITAAVQTNVKRMLAFSSISHAGYMLMAVLAMNGVSAGAILYYTIAYSLATIASFTVVYLVSEANNGNESLDMFNGLAKRNPRLSFVMTVAMLSLSGIPPLAGFFAKYYVFTGAIQSGYTWLVVLGLIGSLVGVYYYFKVIIAMYFRADKSEAEVPVSMEHKVLLIFSVVASILIGLFPDMIIRLI